MPEPQRLLTTSEEVEALMARASSGEEALEELERLYDKGLEYILRLNPELPDPGSFRDRWEQREDPKVWEALSHVVWQGKTEDVTAFQ